MLIKNKEELSTSETIKQADISSEPLTLVK